MSVYSAIPKDNEWEINKLHLSIKHNFYILNNEIIQNNASYFLANDAEVEELKFKIKKVIKNK